MDNPLNEPTAPPESRAQAVKRRAVAIARRAAPFAAGILAAFLAIFIYNSAFPAPQPLTTVQMNTQIAQFMASATPQPAYSDTVYQIIRPSLVLIETEGPGKNGKPDHGLGSGVIVTDAGDILTSLHVVSGATAIRVTFADGSQSAAQIATAQPQNDIAVLKPVQPPAQIVPAVLGNPNSMRVGDEAYVVGNPFGLYSSMTAGVISGFDRNFAAPNSNSPMKGLIQIDSAVNPGNSGGPLLNRYGQVIGIVVGLLNPTDQDFFIGIGFAVPITTAGGALGSPQY